MDDAEIDGCDLDFSEDPVSDELIELYALFAGSGDIDRTALEWWELFGDAREGL